MISQDFYSGVDKKKSGEFSMTSWKQPLDLYPIKHLKRQFITTGFDSSTWFLSSSPQA